MHQLLGWNQALLSCTHLADHDLESISIAVFIIAASVLSCMHRSDTCCCSLFAKGCLVQVSFAKLATCLLMNKTARIISSSQGCRKQQLIHTAVTRNAPRIQCNGLRQGLVRADAGSCPTLSVLSRHAWHQIVMFTCQYRKTASGIMGKEPCRGADCRCPT